MTGWLWTLLAFESLGWALVAWSRSVAVLCLTALALLVALVLNADLPHDHHPYFAIMAFAIHISFYAVVGAVALHFAGKRWPRA